MKNDTWILTDLLSGCKPVVVNGSSRRNSDPIALSTDTKPD